MSEKNVGGIISMARTLFLDPNTSLKKGGEIVPRRVGKISIGRVERVFQVLLGTTRKLKFSFLKNSAWRQKNLGADG